MLLCVSTNWISEYLERVSLCYEHNTHIVGFFNVNICNRTLQLLCCQQLTARISVKYNEYRWKGSYHFVAYHWPNTRTKYFEPSKAHSYRREKRLLASSCLSVRPSIQLYQHCSQWTELLEI
jgi:hypothetical protein